VLSVQSVAKRFGSRILFDGVSLELGAGEYVAIVGDSGIGKSTLLNVIAGLEPIDSGSISFLGREIEKLNDDDLSLLRRERFGFVFQAFHVLPHLTVEENVALPLLLRGISSKTKPREMIAAVGLAGREASPPRELSGGELQRVAIARALVGGPKLVLADEPTGNLDPESAGRVVALLREAVKQNGAACVLATHSRTAAASADVVYRITASGLVKAAGNEVE